MWDPTGCIPNIGGRGMGGARRWSGIRWKWVQSNHPNSWLIDYIVSPLDNVHTFFFLSNPMVDMSSANLKLGWVSIPLHSMKVQIHTSLEHKNPILRMSSLYKAHLRVYRRPPLKLNLVNIKFDCLTLLLADGLPQGPSAGKWTCVCASSNFGTGSHAFGANCSTACDCRHGMSGMPMI